MFEFREEGSPCVVFLEDSFQKGQDLVFRVNHQN